MPRGSGSRGSSRPSRSRPSRPARRGNTHHHHYNNGSRGGGTSACECLACIACVGGTTAFIVSKPKAACIAGSGCVAVFMMFVAMMVAFNTYSPKNIVLSSYTSRLVSPSTYFNSAVELVDPSGGTSLHRFRGMPPAGIPVFFPVDQPSLIIGPDQYNHYNYYLGAGSEGSFDITLLSGSFVNFYIVRGESRFRDWQEGENVHIYQAPITTSGMSTTWHIDSDDTYYFIVENQDRTSPATLHYKHTITIAQYDYTKADDYCAGSCSVSLAYASEDRVVVRGPLNGDPDVTSNVTWKVNARTAFYVGLFGALFMSCSAIVACIIAGTRRRSAAGYNSFADSPSFVDQPAYGAPHPSYGAAPPPSAPPPPSFGAPPATYDKQQATYPPYGNAPAAPPPPGPPPPAFVPPNAPPPYQQ